MAGLQILYEFLTAAGKPALEALLKARAKRGKEDPARINERRGIASLPRPDGALLWLHAASVGEAQSALILISALSAAYPHLRFLVTTGTVTSAGIMKRRLPEKAFHQYIPLDNPEWAEKFVSYWRPDLVLWMESELWPNLLKAVRVRGIPAILVNARLSDRSFSNWMKARRFAASVLSSFDLVMAQSQRDKENFEILGVKSAVFTDNIKYSAAPLPADPVALSGLRLTVAERLLWVYASTHDGEEALACRVHKELRQSFPNLLTIIVPRHPERREEVARACFDEGVKFRLRSDNLALPTPDDDIYVADTMGELGLFYSLCPIAMIGRSFSSDGGGGHNPIEAAQLGCAVVTGPDNQYQRQIYDDMREAGVVLEALNEETLIDTLQELFEKPDYLAAMREKASSYAAQKSRVIDNIMKNLKPLLEKLELRDAA